MNVIGIVDPITATAQSVLEKRLAGAHCHMYKSCQIYASADELLAECKPDVVFIGTQPMHRGNLESGKDLELMFVKAGKI